MEKQITINGKTIIVREVKYKDMINRAVNNSKEDTAQFLIKASTNITEEEFNNLSLKDGMLIQKAVNEVNGLDGSFLQETPQASV